MEKTREKILNQNGADNEAEKRRNFSSSSSSVNLEEENPMPNLPLEMVFMILKAVATKDLLSCRLVCRIWHKFATELYRGRSDASQLRVVYMAPVETMPKKFYFYTLRPGESAKNYGTTDSRGTLPQLMELLENSKDHSTFPCTNFHLSLPLVREQPDDAEMLSFLKLYYRHIRFLTLDAILGLEWTDYLGISIRELLFNILVHVQELTLDVRAYTHGFFLKRKWHHKEETERLNGVSIGIKCLKVMGDPADITFDLNDNYLLMDILSAAENLERIEAFPETSQLVFDPKRLYLIWESGKIHAVKDAHFSPKLEDLDYLETIADCGHLILENLTIDLDKIQKDGNDQTWVNIKTGEILNKILKSSSKTLEVLKIKNPIGFLPNVKFPTMEHLKRLHIGGELKPKGNDQSSLFLANLSAINPVKHFPYLTSVAVQFELSAEELAHWTTLFPCPVYPRCHTGKLVHTTV